MDPKLESSKLSSASPFSNSTKNLATTGFSMTDSFPLDQLQVPGRGRPAMPPRRTTQPLEVRNQSNYYSQVQNCKLSFPIKCVDKGTGSLTSYFVSIKYLDSALASSQKFFSRRSLSQHGVTLQQLYQPSNRLAHNHSCSSTGALWTVFYMVEPVNFLKKHKLLPQSTLLITIVSLVMGLLLVFRNNTAYDRYWEGRRLWATMETHVSINIDLSLHK